ncbi:MAG TPA: ABC transporter ATP-binding protein [Clostridia bacterium]|nr:ABC transporter ATP-binding protein [Clostridia bacterium]
MSKIIIKTVNLTKFYGKSRGILDVSFEVEEGEIFGFIGPNGAGKTTTIRTLLGFLIPTKGRAEIFGLDSVKDSHIIKRQIGYVPSEVNYYDDMKTEDLLLYSSKFYLKDLRNRIKELCEIFEVPLGKKIRELSFGNKKKLAVIQAILHQPRLLILDEPTAGLDPIMQNRFFEILKEENKKGVTIFFSSHVLNEVQKMCNRVAIIKEGEILKIEEIEKLRSNNFKRVKIDFRQKVEFEFNLPGMNNVRKEDSSIEFLYMGDLEILIKKLSQVKVQNLVIEEPSLEEIFLHYYGKEVTK